MRKRQRYAWVGMVAVLALVVGGCSTKTAGTKASETTPKRLSGSEQLAVSKLDEAKPRFDATLLGWVVAPGKVIAKRELPKHKGKSCKGAELDPDTKTPLDFTVTYLPPGFSARGFIKNTCDGKPSGVSISLDNGGTINDVTPYGSTQISIVRQRQPWNLLEVEASVDRVSSTTIHEMSAIMVRPMDPSGFGPEEIIILEDSTFDPYGRTLTVSSSDMSFEELLKVAEGVTL